MQLTLPNIARNAAFLETETFFWPLLHIQRRFCLQPRLQNAADYQSTQALCTISEFINVEQLLYLHCNNESMQLKKIVIIIRRKMNCMSFFTYSTLQKTVEYFTTSLGCRLGSCKIVSVLLHITRFLHITLFFIKTSKF